jgi:glycosyltransferase involved in cell wall biosynthesis
MEGSEEEARLRAELAEARQALDVMAGSLRFQIGDAIVSAFSRRSSFGGNLRAVSSAVRRARTLHALGRVKSFLFSGLPGYGLPEDPKDISLGELKALRRHLEDLTVARPNTRGEAGCRPSHSWSAAALDLGRDFRRMIDAGYPLPDRVGDPERSRRDPRRVLYVSQHDPVASSNGYARRTSEIVQGLVRLGYEVMVVVPKPGSDTAASFIDGRITYRHLPLAGSVGLRDYIETLARRIEEAAIGHGAGTIHAASNYLNGLAGIVAARRLGIPSVYEIRGLWEETRLTVDAGFDRTLGYRFQSQMEVFCADNAEASIAGSAGIAAELKKRGAKADFTIAESGAPAGFEPDRDIARSLRQRFPEGSCILGFVGSITAYEGFATMAGALASLNANDDRYRMLVLGDGRFGAEARALFDGKGQAGNVIFTGKRPLNEARAAYGAIDLALYVRDSTRVTDIVESLKPVEALAAGVPVVVTEVRPLHELVMNCPAVFAAKPSDAAGVAARIQDFFELPPAERTTLGMAGRRWVCENRSWDHTACRIAGVYERFGNGHEGGM